ncbi:hypothetical protein TNCV_3980921 [Trichonephila clavipes]|nr:hypothetical protein TNCV_3980921 [Trichonephila clavipes]
MELAKRKRKEEMELAERKIKEETESVERNRKKGNTARRKEWLDGLDIQTFDNLKGLLITDQMKKKVPTEVRAHQIKSPNVLVEKLVEYEDVQEESKRPAVPFNNKEKSYRKTLPLNTQSSLPQLEETDVMNKEGKTNRRYVNHFNKNSHQARYYQTRITPRSYTCGKEGHFARVCKDKSLNKQNSPHKEQVFLASQSSK